MGFITHVPVCLIDWAAVPCVATGKNLEAKLRDLYVSSSAIHVWIFWPECGYLFVFWHWTDCCSTDNWPRFWNATSSFSFKKNKQLALTGLRSVSFHDGTLDFCVCVPTSFSRRGVQQLAHKRTDGSQWIIVRQQMVIVCAALVNKRS